MVTIDRRFNTRTAPGRRTPQPTGRDFLFRGVPLHAIRRESPLAAQFRAAFAFWPDEVLPGWLP